MGFAERRQKLVGFPGCPAVVRTAKDDVWPGAAVARLGAVITGGQLVHVTGGAVNGDGGLPVVIRSPQAFGLKAVVGLGIRRPRLNGKLALDWCGFRNQPLKACLLNHNIAEL